MIKSHFLVFIAITFQKMRHRSSRQQFSNSDRFRKLVSTSNNFTSLKSLWYFLPGAAGGDASSDVETYWFVCKRWFDRSEDDGLIVRELVPTDESGRPIDDALQGARQAPLGFCSQPSGKETCLFFMLDTGRMGVESIFNKTDCCDHKPTSPGC